MVKSPTFETVDDIRLKMTNQEGHQRDEKDREDDGVDEIPTSRHICSPPLHTMKIFPGISPPSSARWNL
jgi:hypothetical protein